MLIRQMKEEEHPLLKDFLLFANQVQSLAYF